MNASLRYSSFVAAAALLASLPGPAWAQDDDAPSPEAAAAQRVSDQAKLEKAVNDLAAQRVESLGLKSDATGKTTLAQDGGKFEGWLLSANAINQASASIAETLRLAADRPYAILAEDEVLDLSLPVTMDQRLAGLYARAGTVFETACLPPSRTTGGGPRTPGGPSPSRFAGGIAAALPYVGAVINALKTDTTITPFEGPTNARLVINSLAHRAGTGDNWIVPSDLARIDESSPLLQKWRDLADRRNNLAVCRARIAGAAAGDDPAAKARVAAIDVSLAEIDAFETKEVLAGDGASALVKAARLQTLAAAPNLQIVRVYVEKAGGSILQRSNLWTMLGAPAIGITGGAVVGWRVVDAGTGGMKGGGNLSCRTALTGMRAIHRGNVRASSCVWKNEPAGREQGR